MENYDKHLMALGLQRGATKQEIHSAFRRMAIRYHPDQDSSMDAQMRYREARQAYDALRRTTGTRASRSPSYSTAETKKTTTCGAGWAVYNSDDIDPSEALNLPNIFLHDYFSRQQFILAAAVSTIAIFFVQSNFTSLPLTGDSSMRLFWHLIIFLPAAWLIVGYVRSNYPSLNTLIGTIIALGFVHAWWLYNIAFPQEFLEHSMHSWRSAGMHHISPTPSNLVIAMAGAGEFFFFVLKFVFIFGLAAFYLEKAYENYING